MKALVVFESLWGNTAAIARAVAEGIGPSARAVSTGEATASALLGVDLIVVGAPVIAFSLPTDKMIESIRNDPGRPPTPPDLSQPSMKSWLEGMARGSALAAAFETRLWWSPHGATPAILKGLKKAGYRPVGEGERFIVTGAYGPLREGEIARAREWGGELAALLSPAAPSGA